MRIFFDPERGDYRLSVDTSDRNDCEPFLERYGTDTQAACIMRHLVELANEHQPPAGLRTRRSWALALCRFLAFLYGEDLSSDPSTPTLARMTMRRAAEHFAALPTLDHEPTDPRPRLPAQPSRSHDSAAASLDDLYGGMG